YLMKYDIVGEKSERILGRDWDIWGMALSHHGKYQGILINEDAANVIEIIESETGKKLELPAFDNANITEVSISKDETMAVLSVGARIRPPTYMCMIWKTIPKRSLLMFLMRRLTQTTSSRQE